MTPPLDDGALSQITLRLDQRQMAWLEARRDELGALIGDCPSLVAVVRGVIEQARLDAERTNTTKGE